MWQKDTRNIPVEEIVKRLVGDKRVLFLAAVKAAHKDTGYVDFFEVRGTMFWKRAQATANKFEHLGLQISRNNYDGYMTQKAKQVVAILTGK